MKKILFFTACAVAVALAGCNGSNSDGTREDTDSITITVLAEQRDSLLSFVGDISDKMLEINRLEGILSSNNLSVEMPDKRKELFANLEAIRLELERRRMQIDELEQRINTRNHNADKLRATIETQKQLIAAQSQRILDLQHQLNVANDSISRLNADIDKLNTHVDNVSIAKAEAEQRSEALSNELNACYYVIGSRQELKDHNILEKKFLHKSKILENDFDRSFFTRADKRTLRQIQTLSKKARILTTQPVNSYVIEDDKNGMQVIRITNTTLFWEKSDFLVIEVE